MPFQKKGVLDQFFAEKQKLKTQQGNNLKRSGPFYAL